MFGIGYIAVRRIPCNCYACLRKLDSLWNRIKVNYNKYKYKGENQQCSYWPILGSYKNWQIIHFIDSKKQHETTRYDINVNIKKNSIRKITLNIGRDIRDEYYGTISTIDKNPESGNYHVKRRGESYTLKSSKKLGNMLPRLVSWCVIQYI